MGNLFTKTEIDLQIPEDDMEELYNRCCQKFGLGIVNVELTKDNLAYIIKNGMMLLSTWVPKVVDVKVGIKADTTYYTIEEYERVNGLIDVFVSSSYLIGIGLPIQSLMGMPMALSGSSSPETVTDYMSLISAHNTAKQVYQVFPMPELIQPNKILVTPKPYMNDTWIFRLSVSHNSDLSSLNKWEREWLIRYCMMGAGKVIGTVRTKYSGITIPVGSLENSGSTIYSEAVEEEKALMEELKLYKKFGQLYIAVG